MPKKYTVKQGDCLESIAFENGFFWETLWDDASNSALKKLRKQPNTLFVGDVVNVPDLRQMSESCATESTHSFRRLGVPSKFIVIIKTNGEPRANENFIMNVNGETIEGTTDGEGKIEQVILPSTKTIKVELGENKDSYEFKLGALAPIDELKGIQARLKALGLYAGKLDGESKEKTKSAVRLFQEKNDLVVDGIPGAKTQQKLKEIYGC